MNRHLRLSSQWSIAVLLSVVLAACGGSDASSPESVVTGEATNVTVNADGPTVQAQAWRYYSVGGSISGLASGKSVTLKNNGGDALTRTANGAFNFPTRLRNWTDYRVTVSAQPAGQTCAVTNGTGTVRGSSVTSVRVACVTNVVPTYSVGGSLSGLTSGTSVVLGNNGGNNLTLSANGAFAFSTQLANAATYHVTVLTQPTSQTCAVTNGSGTISAANVANVMVTCSVTPVTGKKWHPGIYAKVEDWQLRRKSDGSSANMNAIYEELRTTPQLRGIKVMAFWGRYEHKDPTTGVITYDWSEIDQILANLAKMNIAGQPEKNKQLILGFAWREFFSSNGATNILPNDLRGGTLWHDPVSAAPDWSHIKYDYLWAYGMSHQEGNYAYNLKLWNPMILSRIDAFLAALAAHVDNHPNFDHVSTSESAIGDPVIAFGSGESAAAQYAGQIAIIRSMRKHFVRSQVIPDINVSREHVAHMATILETENMGLSTSNSNHHWGITRPATLTEEPGVLTYFPKFSGVITLAPEIQGDDYQRTCGAGGVIDNPSYVKLYNRVRNDLKANYVVMQRNTPYWLGGTIEKKDSSGAVIGTISIPSMLQFIRTYSAIKDDPTGAGGLNAAPPASISGIPKPPGPVDVLPPSLCAP